MRFLSRPAMRWVVPAFLAGLAWLAYAPGFSGALFYDDLSNLRGLVALDDASAALSFVFQGTAGPLGRPLALASFLPHAAGWPDNSGTILRANVLLHILNAGLLWLLGYWLLTLRGDIDPDRRYYAALSAAALWMLMPLLASTSLIAVQRMTSLSAFFGLLGLLAFVRGYFWLSTRPLRGLALQSIGLGLGVLLAMLSKENGVLIPVFALIIESILLAALPSAVIFRRTRRTALWLWLLAIIGLLIYRIPRAIAAEAFRGFTLIERLMTESVILWQYLRLAFLPRISAFGPFHDDMAVVDGVFAPALAIAAFLLLTSVAFRHRRRNPWPLFALLWFFSAHLLESTVVMIELYFEHRNYLAVYGFCLALAGLAWNASGRYTVLGPVLLTIYGLTLWVVLLLLTLIWGDRLGAAENWVQNRPASARSIMTLSTLYHEELGTPVFSVHVLDRGIKHCPECLGLHMQALLYVCGAEDSAAIEARFAAMLRHANTARYASSVIEGFQPLRELVGQDGCPPLTRTHLRSLAESLLTNSSFTYRRKSRQHLIYMLALIAFDGGERSLAAEELERAAQLGQSLSVLQMQLYFLVEERRFDEAMRLIDDYRVRRHWLPQIQAQWDKQVDEFESLVLEAQIR